jgi:hypothetical protein
MEIFNYPLLILSIIVTFIIILITILNIIGVIIQNRYWKKHKQLLKKKLNK